MHELWPHKGTNENNYPLCVQCVDNYENNTRHDHDALSSPDHQVDELDIIQTFIINVLKIKPYCLFLVYNNNVSYLQWYLLFPFLNMCIQFVKYTLDDCVDNDRQQ